jgi:acid phosphatase type 7
MRIMKQTPFRWLGFVCALVLGQMAVAHVGHLPSVHDVVAGVLDRIRRELPDEAIRGLTASQVEARLSSEEWEVLSSRHLVFRVDVPVKLTLLSDANLAGDPFWLGARGFKSTGVTVESQGSKFLAWEREFEAGEIGLGVNSLRGGGLHYLVLVRALEKGRRVVVDQLYPGQMRVEEMRAGVRPYVDRDETLAVIPAAFEGSTLIRTEYGRRNDGRMVGLYRWTEHPSSERPDQLVLTWSGDPKTTQAIQWRTSLGVKRGWVAYGRKSETTGEPPWKWKRLKAGSWELEDRLLINDPVVRRHAVELVDLEPGTTYVYCVGDGSRRGWTEPAEFTTAPSGAEPFSFIYMGDAQNGLDRWGTLVRNAFRERPDAAFYLMAGDLVNRGNERDDWDEFFHNASAIYRRRPLVPVLGNHECQGGRPRLYLEQFTLRPNGPEGIEPERAYALEYGNAIFLILDSNLDPATQTGWLESQLAATNAKWKFVAYHHPAYSSAPRRDNVKLRELWTPIFDKYHVDLALQGHDHAYLRTYPMKGQQRVESPQEGTVYIVSVSGTKMYSQDSRDYTEFGMTNVSTYQVLDIQISGDRLVYRAYDLDGRLRDELIIEK